VTVGSPRGIDEIWRPTTGVDETTRATVERAFRGCVARRTRRDGESGVFATRAIAEGTVLIHRWHDEYYRGMVGWESLSVDEIDQLPPAQGALFQRYGLDRDFGHIYGPLARAYVTTLDNFINHACEPNLGYDDAGNVVAHRALAVGEELRLDYGSFVVNYDEPFDCRCGHPTCRARVTRHDWRHLATRGGPALPPFVRRRIEAEALDVPHRRVTAPTASHDAP
jgi:hypothetical protein